MAEQGYMLPPLEVFAIDNKMDRATGSIPYTSLVWTRKYYECGQFEMTIPAHIYDPSWAFIDTDMRPETGIIQKVEYSDDPTYGNEDTITISGFFLESIMNRRTFLDETPEQVTYRYYVSPPKPPKKTVANRDVYKDDSGNYWYATPAGTTYGVSDGTPTDSDARRPGSAVQTDESGQAYIETGSGRVDVSKVNVSQEANSYYFNSGSTTTINQTVYSSSSEGLVNYGTVQHDIAFDDGFGTTYYHNANGLVAATGVTKQQADQYVVQKSIWNRSTDNGWVTKTVTVAGPWQTTDIEEVLTPMDNVQRVYQWAREYYQNQMLFEEPTITGETKTLDPSFMLLGDLLYQELQTVEASFRVEYDFINNCFFFSIWRGLDRTQNANSPNNMLSAANFAISPREVAPVNMPDGYTQVEYIEGNGTPYIDTGVKINSNLRITINIEIDSKAESTIRGVAGGRQSGSGSFILWKYNDEFRFDYGTDKPLFGSYAQNTVYDIDLNKNKATVNDYSTTASESSFTSDLNVYLFSINDNGEVDSRICEGKLYSCKIYDDSSLVRDFVPCVRKSDGKSGLIDLVENAFYPSMSGEFGHGPVVFESQDIGWQGLPSGYRQVEYVKNTSNQMINSEYVATNNTKIIAKHNAETEGFVFGGEVGWKNGSFDLHTGNVAYGNSSNSFSAILNTDIVSVLDNNAFYDSEGRSATLTSGQDFTSVYHVYMFATNRGGTLQEWMVGRIYYLFIYENGVLQKKLIPAVRTSDNKAGMYDVVNSSFHEFEGTGTPEVGPDVKNPNDYLYYYPNSVYATGTMEPTEGPAGQQVLVKQCAFEMENGTFGSWNTEPDGSGTTYQPGNYYTLTDGEDVLYAQWYMEPEPDPPSPSGGNPWAVFSDTWGSLYGYTADMDDSNYRNVCYVLYEYDQPTSFDASGRPTVVAVYDYTENGQQAEQTGWRVPYTTKRGYYRVEIDDGDEYDDRETYLDMRKEPPACDEDWSRDEYSISDYPTKPSLPAMKSQYEGYPDALKAQGMALLNNDYAIVTNLETGDLRTDRYLKEYDLGDKVDMAVETVGLKQEARIIGVEEAYESGKSTVNIEIGTPQLDIIKKARMR